MHQFSWKKRGKVIFEQRFASPIIVYIIRNSFCPQNINLRLVSITRPSLEWELLEKNMIDEILDLVAQHSEDDEPIFWYQIGCGVLPHVLDFWKID